MICSDSRERRHGKLRFNRRLRASTRKFGWHRIGWVAFTIPGAMRNTYPVSQAWLGFYFTAMRLLRIKDDLDVVRAANAYNEEVLRYGRQKQLRTLPTFDLKTLGKMAMTHEATRRVNKKKPPGPPPNKGPVDRKKQRWRRKNRTV